MLKVHARRKTGDLPGRKLPKECSAKLFAETLSRSRQKPMGRLRPVTVDKRYLPGDSAEPLYQAVHYRRSLPFDGYDPSRYAAVIVPDVEPQSPGLYLQSERIGMEIQDLFTRLQNSRASAGRDKAFEGRKNSFGIGACARATGALMMEFCHSRNLHFRAAWRRYGDGSKTRLSAAAVMRPI